MTLDCESQGRSEYGRGKEQALPYHHEKNGSLLVARRRSTGPGAQPLLGTTDCRPCSLRGGCQVSRLVAHRCRPPRRRRSSLLLPSLPLLAATPRSRSSPAPAAAAPSLLPLPRPRSSLALLTAGPHCLTAPASSSSPAAASCPAAPAPPGCPGARARSPSRSCPGRSPPPAQSACE